jgi:hypothetical protein
MVDFSHNLQFLFCCICSKCTKLTHSMKAAFAASIFNSWSHVVCFILQSRFLTQRHCFLLLWTYMAFNKNSENKLSYCLFTLGVSFCESNCHENIQENISIYFINEVNGLEWDLAWVYANNLDQHPKSAHDHFSYNPRKSGYIYIKVKISL